MSSTKSVIFGHRSTDAEIFFDIDDRRLTFDYSLTDRRCPVNNNDVIYEQDKLNVFTQIYLEFVYFFRFCYGMLGGVLANFVMVFEHILYPQNNHFKTQQIFQNFMKICCDREQYDNITFGKYDCNILKIHIPKNLYVKYFLEGDYQNQIKKISLKRNIVRVLRYNKQQIHKQDGWNMIFEFKTPPEHGSCIVRYL